MSATISPTTPVQAAGWRRRTTGGAQTLTDSSCLPEGESTNKTRPRNLAFGEEQIAGSRKQGGTATGPDGHVQDSSPIKTSNRCSY